MVIYTNIKNGGRRYFDAVDWLFYVQSEEYWCLFIASKYKNKKIDV